MQKRKLAAIMFTDIQGYTALMQRSEDEALQFRHKHRQVFERETTRHHGEILQYYGDGTLSVFDSAVDAVKCGIDIQNQMQESPAVPLRVGIHSGDIIFTEDDIIGDGVNVASRVESLSVPGSVLISEKVFDEVKNNSFIQTQFLKSFKLKNVGQAIGVYAVTNPGLVVPDVKEITGKLERVETGVLPFIRRHLVASLMAVLIIAVLGFWLGSRWQGNLKGPVAKKIAVLPFEITSLNQDEDILQTGMTDGLIAELSKLDQLTVLDQASTRVLAAGVSTEKTIPPAEISLVDYVVTGSVSRNDNQLAVDIQLKDAEEGENIWSKHYERDISQIRPLWGEVSSDLATPMQIEVKPEDVALWEGLRPVNPETYELYLKGVHHMNKSTPADWQRGLVYFQEAIDRNPADPYAYSGLAEAYIRLGHGPAPPPDVFPKAHAAAIRAIQLDSNLAAGWAALAHYHTYFGWDWELADRAFKRADQLNPNLAYNHYHRAWYLVLFGQMNAAIEEHERAQELDPFTPLHTAWLGDLYRMVGRYEDALAETDKAAEMEDDYALSWLVKGNIYRSQGKHEQAIDAHRRAASINPGWRYTGLGPTLLSAGKTEEGKAIIAELESMPPSPYSALCLGIMYTVLGDNDKALEWLGYEQKHGWYPWIRVISVTESLRQDPRFIALIREMNLPDPAPLVYHPEVHLGMD